MKLKTYVGMLAVAVLAGVAGAAESPFKTPPDWKAEIIAKPPELRWPSVVEQAPDGRIFVAEDIMDMPGPGNKPVDRILCFHPDGHVTVFADHLYAVFGLRYIDGKLYVHNTPRFTVFTDDNGVGKDPVNLIDSDNPAPWGYGAFNDHIPSNIRLAMDGYLYMSVGDKGIFGAKSNADGRTAEIHGGGVLRIRPDGRAMEVYCTGTRNHLDLGVNSEDEIFTYDNTDDGQGWWTRYTHMVDGGFYGYPFDYKIPGKPESEGRNGTKRDPTKPFNPWTLWRMDEYGGGSPTGAVGYNEDALPAEYHGNLFHCEWGKGRLERFVVSRSGGTYKIDKVETMLSGPNFRPLGISVLSDGTGFLVTDWEMGGWANANPQGRLFKLTYTGAMHPAPRPDWYVPAAEGKKFDASLKDLIEGLSHPAESVRLVAQRRIAEHGKDAVEPLIAVLNDSSKPAHARWHAIWALDAIDGGVSGRSAILAVAKDDKADLSVRRQAVRELGTRNASEAVSALIPLLNHKDASLRFRAATALGRIGDPAAIPPLLAKLDEKDFFTHYADFLALRRIGIANSTAWPEIVKGLTSDQPAVREGVLLAAHDVYEKPLVDALSAMASDASAPAVARSAAIEALAPLHRKRPAWDGKWWATQPAGSPPPAKSVEWDGTPVVLAAIGSGLKDHSPEIRRAAIAALEQAPDPGVAKTLAEMFHTESDVQTQRAILQALAASKSPEAMGPIQDVLTHASKEGDLVKDALSAAESVNSPPAVDAILVYVDSGPSDFLPAFAALERMKATAAVPAAAKQISNSNESVALAAVNLISHVGNAQSGKYLATAMTDDKRDTVRKAAALALGQIGARDEIPSLIAAYKSDPAIHNDAIDALARMPDLRALNAYLDGLGGQDAGVRDQCRKALHNLGAPALPQIEARLDAQPPLSAAVVRELQGIYTGFQPILQWRVIGPFAKDGADPAAIEKLPQEQELKDLHGKTVHWKTLSGVGPTGRVDLYANFNPNDHVSAYAVAEIDSTADRDANFVMGSDDGIILWLNGQKIFQDLDDHGYNAEQFHANGRLKAGKNVLVAKITQDGGPWEFSVAVSGARQGKLFSYDTSRNDPQAYAAFALAHDGDPQAGSILFHNAEGVGCIKCHTVNGEGGNVGPNLSDISLKYPREHLIEDVLYPSKQIESGYEQTIIRTKDGNVVSGVVRAETDDEVTLYDSTARKIVIRKSDIDARKRSPLSVMPEGLQAGLTQQQFADLIAYLQTLKKKN